MTAPFALCIAGEEAKPTDSFGALHEALRGASSREIEVVDASLLGPSLADAVRTRGYAGVIVRINPQNVVAWQALASVEHEVPMTPSPAAVLGYAGKAAMPGFGVACGDATVVSTTSAATDLVERWGDRAVLKPVRGSGGEGLVLLDGAGGCRIGAQRVHREVAWDAIEGVLAATDLLAVRYSAAAGAGDRRLLHCGGRLVGVFDRVPAAREWRANLALGASVRLVEPTRQDLEIAASVVASEVCAPFPLVAVDTIAGASGEPEDRWLNEVNVVNVGGMRQLDELDPQAGATAAAAAALLASLGSASVPAGPASAARR